MSEVRKVQFSIPATTSQGRRKELSWQQRLAIAGILFALPAMALFLAFAVYPIIRVFYLSFFDYDLLSSPKFIGLDNYRFLWSDTRFHLILKNTIIYVAGTYTPSIILGMVVALAVNGPGIVKQVLRTIYFIPFASSWIVVSVVWRMIFHPQGLLNTTLGLDINWLTSEKYAPLALIIMSVWKEFGFFLIIFLAGLQTIDHMLYDAARTDGANNWQVFRTITVPLLRPTLMLATVVSVITGFQAFTPQYVMTGGGPGSSTTIINVFIYQLAFAYARMGRATAVAIILFVILAIATLIQLQLYRKEA